MVCIGVIDMENTGLLKVDSIVFQSLKSEADWGKQLAINNCFLS